MLKRKDGRWQEQIKLPGMKKPKYFYGKTQREVKKKIAEWQKEQGESEKFEKVADAWAVVHESQVGYNGHEAYKASMRRVKEIFSSREMKDITASEVDAFIRSLAAKGYARRTVQQHRDLLNMIFNYAIINGFVSINPCSAVKIPNGLAKKERKLPSDEELKKVVDGSGLEFGLFPIMLLYTGLRRAELLALTWNDIDRKEKVIHVKKSVYFVGNSPQIKIPKTEAGQRDVILLDALSEILPDKNEKSYIFGGSSPLSKSSVRSKWIAWCREAGLATKITRSSGKDKNGKERTQTDWRPDITPHQLRHAYATVLYEAKVGLKDAQDLLGHSTAQVTMDVYTHIRKNRKSKVAEQINQYISDSNVIDIKTRKSV